MQSLHLYKGTMIEGSRYSSRTLIYLVLHKGVLDVHNETLNEKYLRLPSDVGRSKNGAFGYLNDRMEEDPGLDGENLIGWARERKF
jgi:hypothetical protein